MKFCSRHGGQLGSNSAGEAVFSFVGRYVALVQPRFLQRLVKQWWRLFKDMPKPGVASTDTGIKTNPDGTIDLFLGPTAPQGMEAIDYRNGPFGPTDIYPHYELEKDPTP